MPEAEDLPARQPLAPPRACGHEARRRATHDAVAGVVEDGAAAQPRPRAPGAARDAHALETVCEAVATGCAAAPALGGRDGPPAQVASGQEDRCAGPAPGHPDAPPVAAPRELEDGDAVRLPDRDACPHAGVGGRGAGPRDLVVEGVP